MMTSSTLPIRRLTLYKHGVAYVERHGLVAGEEVQLVFRADEINDALKSLLVIDARDGQVRGIHYETPRQGEDALAAGAMRLSPDHSLLDLLRALRGWNVRLLGGDGSAQETLSGRLLGVDVDDREPASSRGLALVSVLDEASGLVTAVPLAGVRRVTLLEERSRGDLRFFLDSSRSEEAHRTVVVRLSPGEHDLSVSYLVPSPTWRVTYRLVAEGNAGASDKATAGDGLLLLQGWGLFDNRLDEDLDGVAVTLVAGQPISFIYDLAASRTPHRPTVEDAARVAPGPVEFAATMEVRETAPHAMEGTDMGAAARRGGARLSTMAMPAPMAGAPSMGMVARQEAAATGLGLDELFQYEVTAAVTVGRGESALVPIVSARLPYRRQLLYSEDKLPRHPVAALRFSNATGLVLERGPVTIVEDGAYRGEALVPFTKGDGEVYLAFAVELGITVTRAIDHSQHTAGIRIVGALLHTRHASVRRTVYRLENTLAEERAVTIEHPLWVGASPVDTPPPDEQVADAARWTVGCAPRRVTTFAVTERRDDWHASELLDLDYARLEEFFRHHWLDGETLRRIQALLEENAAIARNRDEVATLRGERDEVYRREEQLRHNMSALGTGGDEGALRRQVVGQLGACEERLRAIDNRIAALAEENTARQARIATELDHLAAGDEAGEGDPGS